MSRSILKINLKLICMACAVAAQLISSTINISAAEAVDTPQIMVSLGDSYSSGEGIPPFYGHDLDISAKVEEDDWLAHRSEKSWAGQLKLPSVDGTMAQNKDTNWFFAATSGATTYHLNHSFNKEYDISTKTGSKDVKAQLDIFNKLGENKADYVTLTLGGNDAGFSDIITSAVLDIGFIKFGNLEDKLNETWEDFYKKNGIRDNLRQAYTDIDNKAENHAKIIVAGYPQLLATNGNMLFSSEEAATINASVTQFNKEINNLVNSCKAYGMKICFVPVEDAFKGHEAYSSDPYINPIILGAMSDDLVQSDFISSYSIHPNEKGAEVYRDLVQKKIDELEKDSGQSEWPVRTTSDERDIVLVLDVSGSMDGEPLKETKNASINFINTVLKEDASIGIVTYDTQASKVSDFSVDEQQLQIIAGDIVSGGSTNIEDGLAKAKELLNNSTAKKKIIVLMSDGQPNQGKVGDELVSYADSIKSDGTYIYTLGFFEKMGNGKTEAQTLMEDIASDGCHYEVSNADDLVFFFGDIADQINGQKYIYVRIECPVDVTVEHNGEQLCSLKDGENTRTSFGTLSFEDSAETYEDSTDDRVKILRLKDGTDYDIKINGNGTGSMNYTIGFTDENGEYSDLREFNDIEISKRTQIDTVAANSSSTVLNVDSDGDGKYDLKYKAKANSIGEIVDYTYIYYIVLAILILFTVLFIYVKVKKWRKASLERHTYKKAMIKKYCVHCGYKVSGDKHFCPKCGNKID